MLQNIWLIGVVLGLFGCAVAASSVTNGYVVVSCAGCELQWVALHGSTPPVGAIVQGTYDEAIETKGTSRLAVTTLSTLASDAVLFEALGLAEGILTAHRAAQHMHNVFQSMPMPEEVATFVADHNRYLAQQSDRFKDEDPYWNVVSLLVARNRGMRNGLRYGLRQPLSPAVIAGIGASGNEFEQVRDRLLGFDDEVLDDELMRVNLCVDIDEIGRSLNASKGSSASRDLAVFAHAAHQRMSQGHGHCSVLLKKVGPRLIFSHNTWKSFNEMLRIWKDVSFPHVRNTAIVNKRISYPSYPGYYASTDDWYVLPDTQLFVTETTDDAHDTDRLARFVRPSSITTPLRSMVASLLAASPREWYEVFSRENSGTQNNQWMIVDVGAWEELTKFAGANPEQGKNVFWILEQQPGLIIGKDMTNTLLQQGYWSSYNNPHFDETMRVSQTMEFESPQCECENQRGPLLAKFQKDVTSIEAMQDLMTTNTYATSGLSWSCPKCSIASRFDVAGNNATMGSDLADRGPVGCPANGAFGAIDAKVADDRMVARGETLFVSGPARIGIAPFDWSRLTSANMPPGAPIPQHMGHPSGPWEFPWQRLGGDDAAALLASSRAPGVGYAEQLTTLYM